jgi:cell wall assembly regulator SMI1
MSLNENKRAEVCREKLIEFGCSLAKGLAEAELRVLEQSLGRSLPEECRAVLREFGEASINDGYGAVLVEDSPIGELLFLEMLPATDWLKSTQWCKTEWAHFEASLANDPPRTSGPARPILIDENRILISMAHGVYWFIDFAPLAGGHIGQVIAVYPMPQEHHVFVVAPDLVGFFESVVAHIST